MRRPGKRPAFLTSSRQERNAIESLQPPDELLGCGSLASTKLLDKLFLEPPLKFIRTQ